MIGVNTLTVLQTGADAIAQLDEGMAILYIGLFVAVTLLVVKLNSAIALLSWAVTGVILVMVFLKVLSAEIYFLTIVLTMIAIAATGAVTAKNA